VPPDNRHEGNLRVGGLSASVLALGPFVDFAICVARWARRRAAQRSPALRGRERRARSCADHASWIGLRKIRQSDDSKTNKCQLSRSAIGLNPQREHRSIQRRGPHDFEQGL